jgi:hypothetical protein
VVGRRAARLAVAGVSSAVGQRAPDYLPRLADPLQDETRPICLRCRRLDLACDGPKDLTFVDASIVATRRTAERPRLASPDTPGTEASARTQLMRPAAPMPENPLEHYIMFTRSHLTKDGPVDVALRELQSRDISQLEVSGNSDWRSAHLQAVLSFATILFGTKHIQPDITRKGYLSHGTTLQQLNRALSRPDCFTSDEIVVSVTTLAIQETLIPSGPGLFISHMEGMEKLLALRNPHSTYSPNTIGLYKCLRHMLLFASLTAGTPSILARPEWKAMFHKYCANDREEQEQQLYDMLADCSLLAFERGELLKRWNTDGDDVSAQLDSLRHNAYVVYDRLRAWRNCWNTNPANAHIEVPASWLSSQPGGNFDTSMAATSPTDLMFSNTTSALMIMLFNVALLNFLKILISLPPEAQCLSSRQDLVVAVHSAVLEVCQSLPHALNAEWQKELHASPVVYWANQSSRMILQGDQSLEAKWLMEMLDRKSAVVLAGSPDVV